MIKTRFEKDIERYVKEIADKGMDNNCDIFIRVSEPSITICSTGWKRKWVYENDLEMFNEDISRVDCYPHVKYIED
ncbi:hypothetical protein [Staphylococcus aureus]|uniref:hypothetical protein n=1 Tax=Staphylococcus aureus TaxID=1280 RepID=UPI0012483C5F|nr:hypothetical protein [Staphylococcus aureus]